MKLPKYFDQVTVNKKRNPNQKRKPKERVFSDADMCLGLLALQILGISRIGLTERLSNETEIAKLLSLPRFFAQSTGHDYLNRFTKWHVKQLDRVNHQLLLRHGSCTSQCIIIVDIDAQTHTLESRKREKAVVGFNRKKRGKPSYQWNIAFVCQEAVAQRLAAGNTHCRSVLLELLDDLSKKLDTDLMILRLDGGYLSGDILNTLWDRGMQIIITCRYDWILSQGVALYEPNWQQIDEYF